MGQRSDPPVKMQSETRALMPEKCSVFSIGTDKEERLTKSFCRAFRLTSGLIFFFFFLFLLPFVFIFLTFKKNP